VVERHDLSLTFPEADWIIDRTDSFREHSLRYNGLYSGVPGFMDHARRTIPSLWVDDRQPD
jgi:hypothetical protein